MIFGQNLANFGHSAQCLFVLVKAEFVIRILQIQNHRCISSLWCGGTESKKG